MRLNDNVNESVFVDDELTAYGFISHMKAYINDLLNSPIKAKPDSYLQQYGINGPKALKMLLDNNKPYGPMVSRVEKIKTGDDNKDSFIIKYTYHNSDNNFYEKMKAIYNKYVKNGKLIKEEGEGGMTGGATASDGSNGQYTTKMGNNVIKRKIYITEKQLDYIREAVQMNTAHGDFGYDATGLEIKKDDPSMNHSNMIKKSRKNGKLTETKLRGLIRNAILESLGHKCSQDRYVEWNIFEIIDDNQFNNLVEQGIIPEELGGVFEIGVRVEYDVYDATYDVPGDSNETNREFFGDDYDDAIMYINMIKDETLKQQALESLNDALYNENYREGDIEEF